MKKNYFEVIDKKTRKIVQIWFQVGDHHFKSIKEITDRFADIGSNGDPGVTTMQKIKLSELKAMVRAWTKEKSLTTAYDICEFLAENLKLEDDDEDKDVLSNKPLIKDEKVRKAVRAWAEATRTTSVDIQGNELESRQNDSWIIFDGEIVGLVADAGDNYTITELCGEEEECES